MKPFTLEYKIDNGDGGYVATEIDMRFDVVGPNVAYSELLIEAWCPIQTNWISIENCDLYEQALIYINNSMTSELNEAKAEHRLDMKLNHQIERAEQ